MRKLLSILIMLTLLGGLAWPAFAASDAGLDAAVKGAAACLLKTVKAPQVDAVGGEWVIIGLARSGYNVPDSYYENYYRTVEKYVKERGGVLHELKYTEYSRLMLSLTAAGYDPRAVAGYDLTAPLRDFENTLRQGLNGPVFALIALDSLDYPSSLRAAYIAEILRRQLSNGGWNLAGGGSESTKNQAGDPDITGMALQALAKYQSQPEVKAATDKALAFLAQAQDATGGYQSWGGENIESTVQVLVALCELGIPVSDARFVKNGHTLVDHLLSLQNADGSFQHTHAGGGNSQMATEQAFYGLVAAQRAANGQNSLYRMGDSKKRGESGKTAGPPLAAGLPGKHADVRQVPLSQPGTTFTDTASHPNKTAIEALAAREIINGKGGGTFDPDGQVTRAEFAKMAVNSLGLPEKAGSPFSDVPAGQWYTAPIAAACYYEIVKGVGGNKFDPGGAITRQEAAVMIARAAKLCGLESELSETEIRDTLAQFGDYRTAASWAQPALAFCYGTGILDDDKLDIKPAEAVKRCEIAEMLYRMLRQAELL